MIDKRLLQDVVTVSKVDGKDDFGDVTYSKPLDIKPVRFDRSVAVTGANNSKTRQKVGVVYIYPKFASVTVDDSWLGAIVNDGVRDYLVTGYQPNYLNGKIFSYEVEVT
ncbi:putative minor capsid protein [Streptococcus dysgalactiae]|uniref:Minor capsid protein 2 n=1 Tax=Streptococcus dysgalactiae subsp. equisimilis TaxID=119602 RepID=A0AAE9R7Q0_STREQ|nr:putative minor capsid protein [Streptococcus dysgalactiae]OBY96744.1 capsid protein [Streptococcus dysgalactiae subsp. equisimilis]SQB82571.1 putative minor capsid protein 2 [Streptococcus dysgalactiae]VTT17748.1 putative minor capsid protein 2 [Streptococcus dysgalactiae]VTT27446.1 putative minor capsid protein 2 [Streptococcus dysgalactiae subsp. equisimilis]